VDLVRLLLVRHGQTPSNVQQILDTVVPGPELTELGQEQARALVCALAGEDITAIVTSNLVRTQLTAAPLAAARNLEVVVRDGIGEIPAGTLEGSGAEADTNIYRDVIFAWAAGDLAPTMPGDARDGAAMLGAFDEVVAEAETVVGDGTALIVSHGGAIRTWAASRASNIAAEYAGEHALANTGIVIMNGSIEAGWTVESWQRDPVGVGMG
jgi:broad specificity phosphatase PhoE